VPLGFALGPAEVAEAGTRVAAHPPLPAVPVRLGAAGVKVAEVRAWVREAGGSSGHRGPLEDRQNRIECDHGSPPVMIVQALVVRRSRVGVEGGCRQKRSKGVAK
jgi:hypothetical protein